MAKQKIKSEFLAILSEKLMDLGNLVVAGLVLGQFVSGREFSANLFIIGIAVMAICYIISYIVSS